MPDPAKWGYEEGFVRNHEAQYFDQTKYHSFAVAEAENHGRNPFQQSQYLLLNLALGREWGGKIDDSILPQKYYIDYVRVYQKEPVK